MGKSLKKYFSSLSRFVFIIIAAPIIFLSCDEVIDINVDDFVQNIVIEASISDAKSTGNILLSKSQNAFKQDGNTSVTGAKIYLSDNFGNTITAKEYPQGKYSLPELKINYGDTYNLKVFADGKEYDASSTLNEPMKMDSVKFYESLTYSIFGFNLYNYKMNIYLANKPGVDEYCIVKITSSYSSDKYTIVYQDKYAGDKPITITNGKGRFQKNENVTIEIYTIDKSGYDYFYHLNELSNGNGVDIPEIFNIITYNPKSNLSNGALGCFYAYSYKKYSAVAK